MAASCRPPKPINVKGHWRTIGGRRKKRAKRKRSSKTPAGPYWTAENQHGKTCGHHHRSFMAAASCSRKTQRAYRAKYGRQSQMGGTWTTAKRGKS